MKIALAYEFSSCSVLQKELPHRNVTALSYKKKGGGTAVAQWLRCCATKRKVAGSIPAGVIGIFR